LEALTWETSFNEKGSARYQSVLLKMAAVRMGAMHQSKPQKKRDSINDVATILVWGVSLP
jgi:hypothetical protein